MNSQHKWILLLSSILFFQGYEVSAKKKAPDTKKPAIIRHYMFQGGAQFGIGMPITNSSSGDFEIKNSLAQNFNAYLKLRLKHISIYGGIQTTVFNINRNALSQAYADYYTKNGYDMVTYSQGSLSSLVTPYWGLGYHFTQKKVEIEPFVRFGLGFQNYDLGGVQLVSSSIANNNQDIGFVDNTPSVSFRPSIGVNASTKLFNFIRLKGSLVFDAGTTGRNEIQEYTKEGNSLIRKRNIYLQNSANQLCLMIGFEVTPFNRIFLHEKKYQKWLQKQSQ